MNKWKLVLLFIAGFVAGAFAWAAGDLTVLDRRSELEAHEAYGTELFADEPVRRNDFSKLSPEEREKLFPIWGRAFFGVSDFKLNDSQGRTVLKVQTLRGNLDLDKLRTGVYRRTVRQAEEIDLWLYRAPSGEVSLAEAFSTTPQLVKADLGLAAPPGDWTMEVGPVLVGRARLHIMLTGTPIVIELEDATVYARQRPGELAPKIFIENATAKMLEPLPLPDPIPIPHATAVVSLAEEPLVDLTAVACVNGERLDVRVIVPTKTSRVFITANAGSAAGGLGMMGLETAGKTESELDVKTGPVQVRKEVDCSGRRVVELDEDDNIIEE